MVLVPQARPQPVAAGPDGLEPLLVEGQAEPVLAVVAVAVRLDGNGVGGVARRVVLGSRAAVRKREGRRAAGDRGQPQPRRAHEVEPAEGRAPVHGRARLELRFGPAAVVGHVHQVRRHPVAASALPVGVHARGHREDVAQRGLGLQVAERVPAGNRPPRAIELVDPRRARPRVDQPVPAGVDRVVGGREQALIAGRPGVVEREVRRQVGAPRRRLELGRQVVAFEGGGALHPVAALLPRGRHPRVGLGAEQGAGVEAQVVALRLALAQGDRRAVALLALGRVGGEVERPPERLDRPRRDVRRALRHLDGAHVRGVDEAVGLRPAPVVGRAVGEPVDGRADLRLVEVHLEAAHRDAGRPVVAAVGVALLDGHPRQVVDDGQHAADGGLLGDHRLRHDVGGERPRLVRHDGQRLRQPLDLQHDLQPRGRAVGDGGGDLPRLEARQDEDDDVVAGGQRFEREAPVDAGHPLGAGRGPGAGEGDGHPGQRAASRVGDGAFDRPGRLGGGGRAHRQEQEGGGASEGGSAGVVSEPVACCSEQEGGGASKGGWGHGYAGSYSVRPRREYHVSPCPAGPAGGFRLGGSCRAQASAKGARRRPRPAGSGPAVAPGVVAESRAVRAGSASRRPVRGSRLRRWRWPRRPRSSGVGRAARVRHALRG